MPIYNSKDNDILSALEKTYRAMQLDEVSKKTPDSKAKIDLTDRANKED